MVESARGGLGECPRFRRGMAFGQDHGRRPESAGRAQDGADVLGIRDLIQQQKPLRSFRKVFENLLQGDEGKGLDQRGQALMRGACRQQGGKGRRVQPLGRPGEVVLGQGRGCANQPPDAPVGVADGRSYRVVTI